MENLIFCLNATIPIFLTLMLGLFFRKIGLFDDTFVSRLNKFVFNAALPALLFLDIAKSDFYSVWNTKFVLFCFFVTLISIGISTGLSYLLKPRNIQGEFIQASYRSSAAILGIAIIQNLYGNAGMAPLIILGILTGMVWSLLHLPMPTILNTAVDNLGKTATPLGLMAMGGALKFGKAFARPKPLIACSFLKLVGYEAVFLPLAVLLGFSHDMLVAIIIMLGSATTVSCYIMAKNMDYDGDFTSGVVMTTTLLSSFTMTIWLYICKSLGLI